jgi:hypothetical protein
MRARNLKPALFRNELLAVSEPLYTIIFEGLWCLADRAGRLEDRPAKIHLEINPGRAFDGTVKALEWLAESGFLVRYEAAGVKYIQVVNFTKHQNPHIKEPKSTIPAPGQHGASTVPARLTPDSGYLTPSSLTPDSLRSGSSSDLSLSSSERAPPDDLKIASRRRELKAAVPLIAKAMP